MTSARNSLLLDATGRLRVWRGSLHRRGQAMRKQRGVIVLGTVIFHLLLLPPACLPACQGARPPPRSLLFISPGSSPPILGQTKQHP